MKHQNAASFFVIIVTLSAPFAPSPSAARAGAIVEGTVDPRATADGVASEPRSW
jgi:hypothetical protein